MSSGKRRTVVFQTDERQLEALRLHARALERDGRRSVARVIREAIGEYLSAHAGERRGLRREDGLDPLPWFAGRGKTPARIMLHLRDAKRLKLLRLHSALLPGTHRTVGRVIRAAIDEYLETHEEELADFLKDKRAELRDFFPTWKGWVLRGGRQKGMGALRSSEVKARRKGRGKGRARTRV